MIKGMPDEMLRYHVNVKGGLMGLFHSHGAAKFGLTSLIVGVLHFFEDFALILAGRHTDINIWMILLAGALFSLCIAGFFKLGIVKKHLL